MGVVYHSSPSQGLKVIKANISTHNQKWVYATRNIEMTAVFLSRYGGDFTCSPCWDPSSNKPYICERYEGAFEERYGNKKGSIYILPDTTFNSNQTSWSQELISTEDVQPINEIVINDSKEYLLSLYEEGRLQISFYPQKFHWIPNDDEDLVKKGVQWTRQYGNQVLEDVKKFHPSLLTRVEEGLKTNKYL